MSLCDYGFLDDMYDDDDDVCDFDDFQQLNSLHNSIFGTHAGNSQDTSLVTIPKNYLAQLSINSTPDALNNLHGSKPFISDSLQMYLTAPPLLRKAETVIKHPSPVDSPIDDDAAFQSRSIPELYVGNIPDKTEWSELKRWFIQRGYGVSYVAMKNNAKGVRYAFVRFDSMSIAKDVLFKHETHPEYFTFNDCILNIKQKEQSLRSFINKLQYGDKPNVKQKPISVAITDIYYGRLITGAAIKNIQRKNSIVSSYQDFGIIAHHLMNYKLNTSFNFTINTEKKKLAITGDCNLFSFDFSLDTSGALKFEWSFPDLKGQGIVPVLIDRKDVYILVEIKRPPIILETQSFSSPLCDTSKETRLPGTSLMGHANAWLFRLSSNDVDHDYVQLFEVLHRYNLSQRQYTEGNILHLVNAKRDLTSLLLISNDHWVKRNQAKVAEFFQCRWPSYPFQTRFEIMKLISKHIISVNDLIVDEEAENILQQVTISALSALVDKIIELAPKLLSATCDNDNEDDTQKEEEDPEEEYLSSAADAVSSTANTSDNIQPIRSTTTGKLISRRNFQSATTTSDPSQSARHDLGTFSRLLISAQDQLLKKHQLQKESAIFYTKLELRNANTNLFLLRKIYITPSTIFYEGPYREETCAVTREYAKYQDRFLRVTFRDEGMSVHLNPIGFLIDISLDYRPLHNYNDNMSKMYKRIKDILINGISICDRHYQFLAFSSSQIREHSCWMFASINDGPTVDSIRAWMGNFENVRPVAKYAARLGQSFSTSVKGLNINNFHTTHDYIIKEKVGERTYQRCFTDGIGVISRSLAKKLAKEMQISDESIYPSAFQIRCGGFKGMVCLDIFNRIKEPNIDVYFRPSMKKFDATSFSIDIVRSSLNPSVAYLNRQIILLLTALGIPADTFFKLQDDMLEQLQALTGNSREACRALKDLNELGGNGFHSFLSSYLKKLGEQRDPFVQRLLRLFKAFLVKELRTKAKIRVPNSWCLLGVIDESATLLHGQVFIQIDNSSQQKEGVTKEIFKGPVIVTRNPCFHPGDIRKLEAVDLPQFHDLKNVIVFPKNGPRPHPIEMSGGDLDGDNFWISRYPDLIFQENEEPFDYQEQADEAKKDEKEANNEPYTIKDVCEFFGEYIAADNLGIIAISHLVLADQSDYGALDEKCLKLARLHSVAVDFAKNGVSAPQLTNDLRPKAYPHYLEKKDKTTYRSETVLGVLYDKVAKYSIDLNINQSNEITDSSSFPYQSFIVNDIAGYIPEAEIMKNEYDRDLKRIMRQYGIRHEVELVSGYILQFTSKQYENERIQELRYEIAHAYRAIQDKYIRLFWQGFYQFIDRQDDEQVGWRKMSKQITWKNQLDIFERADLLQYIDEVKKKASAWFKVTYDSWRAYVQKYGNNTNRNSTASNGQQERFRGLFSFAWLVYPVLLQTYEDTQ